MDGAGRGRARWRPEALQRDSPRPWQHLATDVDVDPAGPRTGRAGHAHRVPLHSAARRLRTDKTWTIVAQAGERTGPVGQAEPWARQNRAAIADARHRFDAAESHR